MVSLDCASRSRHSMRVEGDKELRMVGEEIGSRIASSRTNVGVQFGLIEEFDNLLDGIHRAIPAEHARQLHRFQHGRASRASFFHRLPRQ